MHPGGLKINLSTVVGGACSRFNISHECHSIRALLSIEGHSCNSSILNIDIWITAVDHNFSQCSDKILVLLKLQ
jgi:hypothetical protein